ncbi:hypothetical protein LTR50_007268 [Elasticomyces elasticus]|nr:hypothetical protein LTR50_007268 [Elasticomyces elasticus]
MAVEELADEAELLRLPKLLVELELKDDGGNDVETEAPELELEEIDDAIMLALGFDRELLVDDPLVVVEEREEMLVLPDTVLAVVETLLAEPDEVIGLEEPAKLEVVIELAVVVEIAEVAELAPAR